LWESAAKQEAFEEVRKAHGCASSHLPTNVLNQANRLKNQFRAIDEDEADFLESVLESTRAQEDAIRRETAESLAAFRKQQEEKEKAALGLSGSGSPLDEEEAWTFSGKKRKKGKQKEFLKGIKLRKTSSADSTSQVLTNSATKDSPGDKTEEAIEKKAFSLQSATAVTTTKKEAPSAPPRKASTSPVVSLGLGNYSSDDDDD
jgi:hypothetical protein